MSAFLSDLAQLAKGGYKQLFPVVVDMATVGESEYSLPCAGIVIPSRIILPAGQSLVSQTTKRLWLRVNSGGNPWLPFSLLGTDYASIAASINKFWVRVDTDNQMAAGSVTVLLCSLGVSLSPAGGAGGGGALMGYPGSVTAVG